MLSYSQLYLTPSQLRQMDATLLEVLQEQLCHMLVHLCLRLQVSFLHTVLEGSVDAQVCVELLHQATDRDASVSGRLLHHLLRVGQSHKLSQVSN